MSKGMMFREAQSIGFDGQSSDEDGDVLGTGWLVDNWTIATAGHCVDDKTTKHSGTQPTAHWCCYTSVAAKSDLWLIRLNFIIHAKLSNLQTPVNSPPGGRLIARRYPNNPQRPNQMQESQYEANYDLHETDWSLEYELNNDGGSSGCPIFDQCSKVVRIHIGTEIAKGDYHEGEAIKRGVIIDNQNTDPAAFCAVLGHIDPMKMFPLRGLSRGMSFGTMRVKTSGHDRPPKLKDL
ncbi:hypothetical protein NM208_g3202 [Fusarium decemcellulare]|uniref:Uncharacterized protein n=1 Tax=Fusarium decemcellulare TaxID=57161 RepID=A0ACC1SQC3_9HYPO|nr:hypothetical protein NM208_g3202 [Fusarium decemcellulare]